MTRMLARAENRGKIHGIKVSRESPFISNLMFANDLTIFCRAKVEEVGALLDCFNKFNAWSGQAINFAKSSIYFSGNVTIDLKKEHL